MRILLLGKDGQVGWQLQRALAPHGQLVACGRAACDLSDPAQIRSVVREIKPAVIVKQVDAKTRSKTSINELLRA